MLRSLALLLAACMVLAAPLNAASFYDGPPRQCQHRLTGIPKESAVAPASQAKLLRICIALPAIVDAPAVLAAGEREAERLPIRSETLSSISGDRIDRPPRMPASI